MIKIPVALQLYTVRDETEKDFIGTLEKVAGMGYKGVEFAGFGSVPASRMKAELDRLGLKAVGSHTALELLKGKFGEVVEYNLEIGNKYVICPFHSFDSKEDVLEAARLFNEIGEKCREKGLQFGYHNHDHEFKKFNGEYGLDLLYKETKPQNMIAEMDTCWIFFAGVNPAEYIRKYKGRCPLIHLKDLKTGKDKTFAEVGSGVVDVASVIKASEESGAEWFIVEQDRCCRPSLESAAISIDNLKKMGL